MIKLESISRDEENERIKLTDSKGKESLIVLSVDSADFLFTAIYEEQVKRGIQ